jgi:hypothetical protein
MKEAESVMSRANVCQKVEIIVQEVFLSQHGVTQFRSIHTKLSNICQTSHIGLLEDLQFFCC